GSSAMGGVVRFETEQGSGPPSGAIYAGGGSFGTFDAGVTGRGSSGPLSYSGSFHHLETDNDRPGNEFSGRSYSGRLEARGTFALAGLTFRGQDSDYNEPGSRLFPFAGMVEFSNYLT